MRFYEYEAKALLRKPRSAPSRRPVGWAYLSEQAAKSEAVSGYDILEKMGRSV